MTTGLDPALEYHVVNSLGWPDLRPLQRAAVDPIRAGADCLLLAPTAGGKTEAAVFPLLSQMQHEDWRGLSVLYVTPLRALLNNLHPRLSAYGAWLGRRVGLWHGDVGQGERRRLLGDSPDVLLTTPESLEAMLVSTRVDHRALFAHVRAVVVDELHAFAGDDRGWHLLAVLERIQRLAGRRIQRIGLSATVGNPDELLDWMQGGTPAERSQVVAPEVAGRPTAADVTLDYVGSVANAATVISMLHRGEKRLVFCESRSQAEELAGRLRELDVQTFVSHSSLSSEERRRSEQAFAEARDCVVVATSTLELGIDVGDLDRVIQMDAPRTVASFLQRLGRTGRRPNTSRNTLFLATREDSLLQAAALLRLWRQGFVEPVQPPPSPRHIEAQQLLAVALQEGAIGLSTWREWWPGLSMMDDGQEILDYLVAEGFLAVDSGMAFVSDASERHFGRRNFMDLTAVFTVDPQLTVTVGRKEIGTVSPLSLNSADRDGPTYLALAGRSWRVTHVDWKSHTVSVVEEVGAGRSRWATSGIGPGISAELAQSIRAVLLGEAPEVDLSNRAATQLAMLREERALSVDPHALVLIRDAASSRFWSFAGERANRSLAAAMSLNGLDCNADATGVSYPGSIGPASIRAAADAFRSEPRPTLPIRPELLEALKFSVALPPTLAVKTLEGRLGDAEGALLVASAPCQEVRTGG